jgi:hypothetical protein
LVQTVESTSSDDPLTQSVLQEAKHAADEIKMSLNGRKTVVLKCDFTRIQPSKNWQFSVDGDPVSSDAKVTKLLGVKINSTLTWNDHVDFITTKATKRFWTLRSLQKLGFPPKDLVAFYKSSIIPLLEYASPVWSSGLSLEQIRCLECIQCRALRIIVKRKLIIGTTEFSETLRNFSLQLLVNRREQLLLKFGIGLLNSERFRYLLPNFHMNIYDKRLRKQNLILPTHCYRTRYQKSTIPSIIALLNKEYKDNHQNFIKLLKFKDSD